jgi:hypothetical protein
MIFLRGGLRNFVLKNPSSDLNVWKRVKNGGECIRTVRENLVEEPYSFKLVTSIPGRWVSLR